jgi:lipoprotein NlpI
MLIQPRGRELIKMYLIFDSEDTCVGTVLRHAVENTTIAEALTHHDFYLVEVDEMGNPKAYVEEEE